MGGEGGTVWGCLLLKGGRRGNRLTHRPELPTHPHVPTKFGNDVHKCAFGVYMYIDTENDKTG